MLHNTAKLLTCPLSQPTKAVALYSIPDMFPLELKLLKIVYEKGLEKYSN